jgi:hypothetical protein
MKYRRRTKIRKNRNPSGGQEKIDDDDNYDDGSDGGDGGGDDDDDDDFLEMHFNITFPPTPMSSFTQVPDQHSLYTSVFPPHAPHVRPT